MQRSSSASYALCDLRTGDASSRLAPPWQLRAIAVLERDARKASGQSPLVPTPPPALPSPAPEPEPEPELAAKVESPAAPAFGFAFADLGLPLPVPANATAAVADEMDLDDSFLNDSLFGDSTAPSPAAGVSEQPGPFDLSGLDAGAGVIAPALPESTPMPDLNTLLAMVTSAGADALPAPDFVLPPYGLNAFDGSADLGDLSGEGAPPGGIDLSMYDFGSGDLTMGDGTEVDLDALMKSLGAGS